MKTAISVELGGASYSLDQDAYFALHAYLDRASARLGEHPDRDEVLAGLERSVGAKLARAGARSAPFTGEEMAAALKEVGKVDGPQLGPRQPDRDGRSWRDDGDTSRNVSSVWRDDGASLRDGASWPRPRRLYRLDDGKRIAGVCTGLAAFTNLDVSLIRALFVIGAFFSGGVVFIAYVALMFAVPLARTSTEIAAAHGALRSA
jgi:phage shock protein PspC (stress-responsive transcriptional regulator)